MAQFAKFEDTFRNQLMNTHEQFAADHAMRIFEDVRAFMQILANRITEKSRTPVVWKGRKWVES
jgi:hypothetical protein